MYQSADHSLVNALLYSGQITPEDAKDYPRKNVITRALQPHSSKRFKAETHILHDVKDGDYFFLCCDGVLEQLTNDKLVEILSTKNSDAEKIHLIESESLGKTKDNFTAYLIPIDKVERPTGNIKSEEPSVKIAFAEWTMPQKAHRLQYIKSSKRNKKIMVVCHCVPFSIGYIWIPLSCKFELA